MRTHAHVALWSPELEGVACLQLVKGVSSRRLTEAFGKPGAPSWWTRHGSRRLLTNRESVVAAIGYVRGQEYKLAWWDFWGRSRG